MGFLWIGWSQLASAPWLDPGRVRLYVAHSPFAAVISAYSGFVPLVEILGGFGWLLQMSAPLAFWPRALGKTWAVLLFVSQIILSFFLPLVFWNLIPAIAIAAFFPQEWLTVSKDYWVSQREGMHASVRGFSFVLVMAVMISTVFDRNIAEQFDIFEKMGSVGVEKAYEIATDPFVRLGNLILFNSIWKMYSPTWRRVVWIEWYARNSDGKTVNWPEENFSPDYRMKRRTWLETLWTDFKKEKVFIGMLSRQADRAIYGKYLCHVIAERTGEKPVAIHSEINSFQIRGHETAWSLKEQPIERTQKDPETSCDE